jgi:hypothetical protein
MTKMKVNGMDGCKGGCKLSSTEHELCISFVCCFCEKKPPLLFCHILQMQGRKPGARRQEEHALDWVRLEVFRRGGDHPLTSSVRNSFLLSFCTPFSNLHSSARNHATWFSMFFLSSSIKRTFCCFSLPVFLGTYFALQVHVFNPGPPLEEKVALSIVIPSDTEQGGLFF